MKTKLILSLLIPITAGLLASYFTANGVTEWFPTIIKPSFNPPSYLFAPVWTVLYILMGVGLYRILKAEPNTLIKNLGIIIFGIQMILNFLWSFIFFYSHNIFGALIDIVLMWIFILWMIVIWYQTDKKAALIQIPYILWVTFATILNASIWLLN